MRRKFIAGAVFAAAVGALAAPHAKAETQTIDATLGSSVSMTTAPSNVASWALAASGTNTKSGGSLAVSANSSYTVSVVAEKATLSEWDGAAYVTGGKSLASALTVSATRTGGTAPVAATSTSVAVATVAGTLVTGSGGGTDEFSVSLSQPTLSTDKPLSGTNTYHNKLTYTASAAL